MEAKRTKSQQRAGAGESDTEPSSDREPDAGSERLGLARRIVLKRTQDRISQATAAEQLGITRVTLRSWELGHQRPDPERWEQIARWLDVPKPILLWELGVLDEEESRTLLEHRKVETFGPLVSGSVEATPSEAETKSVTRRKQPKSRHAVVGFGISGPDANALREFYRRILYWRIEKPGATQDRKPLRIITGGIGGTISESSKAGISIVVSCDGNVSETLRRAKALGGEAAVARAGLAGGPVIAYFTDPDGNLIGLVDSHSTMSGKSPAAPAHAAPVNRFEIAGHDWTTTRDFYSELFGWEVEEIASDYGECYASSGPHGAILGGLSKPYITVYSAVDDMRDRLMRVRDHHCSVAIPPTISLSGGPPFALFIDPAGNLFGLRGSHIDPAYKTLNEALRLREQASNA